MQEIARYNRGYQLSKGGKKHKLFIAGGVTIVVVAIVGASTFGALGGFSFLDKPISAFAIGSDVVVPDDNTFKNSAKIFQGDVLRLQMRYDAKKVQAIKVKIYSSDNKVAIDAGTYKVGAGGDFSVAMSSGTLKPGEYTAKVADQSDKQIYEGKLTVTEKQKKSS